MPDPVRTIGVSSPLFGGDGRPSVEPGAFLVTGEDNLRINSWNSLAGVVLTITIRFLDTNGEIIPYVYTHTPNTNRTKATTDFPLGVGFPLNVQIVASSGTPVVGQTFVQAQIIRGLGGATQALSTLLQGYVTAVQAVSWPGSPIVSSTATEGVIRSIAGTTPAAAAEISETVPTLARWELISFHFVFSADANVFTRHIKFLIDDGANTFFREADAVAVTAGQTHRVTAAQGVTRLLNDQPDGWVYSLPVDVQLSAGYRIGTATDTLQAADQFSSIRYLVRERLEAA